jgi:hypothetical protein
MGFVPPIFTGMFLSSRRLIAYYESEAFAQDHRSLMQRDPAKAMAQRRTIIDKLNENMAVLGSQPTPADLAARAQFVAGTMPMEEMLAFLRQYTASIGRRWSA